MSPSTIVSSIIYPIHEDILVRACGVRVCWKCQTSNFAKFIHRFVIGTVSVSGIWFV